MPHVCWRRSACLHGELSRIGEAARSSSNFSLSSVSIFEVCPGPFLFLKGLFFKLYNVHTIFIWNKIMMKKEKLSGSCMNPFFFSNWPLSWLMNFHGKLLCNKKEGLNWCTCILFLYWTKLFCTLKRRMASESSLCISSNDSSMKKMMMPLCMSC